MLSSVEAEHREAAVDILVMACADIIPLQVQPNAATRRDYYRRLLICVPFANAKGEVLHTGINIIVVLKHNM